MTQLRIIYNGLQKRMTLARILWLSLMICIGCISGSWDGIAVLMQHFMALGDERDEG